jgi:hypothetical protein
MPLSLASKRIPDLADYKSLDTIADRLPRYFPIGREFFCTKQRNPTPGVCAASKSLIRIVRL